MGMGCKILYLRPGRLVVPDAGLTLSGGVIASTNEITPQLQQAIDRGIVQVISAPEPAQEPVIELEPALNTKPFVMPLPPLKKKTVQPIKRKL